MNITDEQLKVIFEKATWVPVIPLKNEMKGERWGEYHQRLDASAPEDRTTWAWHVSDPEKNLQVPIVDQNAVMAMLQAADIDPLVVVNSVMFGGNDAGFIMISKGDVGEFNRLKARYGALEPKA